nr:L,D-transpeptidase [Hazenella coriacea]
MFLYSIKIRLSKRRLYLLKNGKVYKSYPVGVGKVATKTPEGTYRIVNRVPYPYSRPGGKLSPFGTLWFGLSRPHYGIHGTNRPSSIGKRVSRGCIRMYNQDVEDLDRYVGIGTTVVIKN